MVGVKNFPLCDHLRNTFCRCFGKDSGWSCFACAPATVNKVPHDETRIWGTDLCNALTVSKFIFKEDIPGFLAA